MLVAAGTVPAVADDDAGLRAKVNAAMAGVRAMQIRFTAGNGATGIAAVLPHPERMKVQFSMGPASLEVYEVDGFMYRSVNGGPWSKSRLGSGANLFAFTRSFDVRATVKAGPDDTEDGVRYGTFTVDEPSVFAEGAGPGAATIDCSYDKATYRLHRCANNGVTMTYGDYDDPKLTVELPAAAAAASAAPAGLP